MAIPGAFQTASPHLFPETANISGTHMVPGSDLDEPVPAPKKFPWYWIVLRVFQVITSCLVFVSTVMMYFSVKGKIPVEEGSSQDRVYGSGCAECVVVAASIPFYYSLKTLVLRFRMPTGLAKCAPIVLGGDISMVALLIGIKKASVRLLKKAAKATAAAKVKQGATTDSQPFATTFENKVNSIVRRFTEHVGRHHHHHDHSHKFKACWKNLKNAASKSNEFRACWKKAGGQHGQWHSNWRGDWRFDGEKYQKFVEKCKLRFVKGTVGVSMGLFLLTAFITLYIVYTNRRYIFKYISEVRSMLRKRREERRLRCRQRREARAARRGSWRCQKFRGRSQPNSLPRCCDHVCTAAPSAPESYSDYDGSNYGEEKKSAVDSHYSAQLYCESTAAHPLPGAFPAVNPPPPFPVSAAESTIVEIDTSSTLHNNHQRTPSISSAISSMTFAGDRTPGSISSDGFTIVNYVRDEENWTDHGGSESDRLIYTPATGTSVASEADEDENVNEDTALLREISEAAVDRINRRNA